MTLDFDKGKGLYYFFLQILLQPVFYGTVVPVLSYYIVKKLILDPFEERKKAKEKEKQLEANRAK